MKLYKTSEVKSESMGEEKMMSVFLRQGRKTDIRYREHKSDDGKVYFHKGDVDGLFKSDRAIFFSNYPNRFYEE